MLVSLNCVKEDKPGEKWQTLFEKSWPFYKKWYLSEGALSRPGYLTCREMLEKYMPELIPIYEKLCILAGDGDLVSRYLSLYNPPPFMSGCTQLAWTKPPVGIIRNYDYNPRLFEGVMLYTNWLQPIIGISDCNWGLLDGMNIHGLAISLTFGGRKISGVGFGIPLVLRYALETCRNTAEARMVFMQTPVHMAYNITIIEKSGQYCTLYLSPDRPPIEVHSWVATNHQMNIEWNEYAAITGTLERKQFLDEMLINPYLEKDDVRKRFFGLPLYHQNPKKFFATLYTADYNLEDMSATILWPNHQISQSFETFVETREVVNLKPHPNELGK